MYKKIYFTIKNIMKKIVYLKAINLSTFEENFFHIYKNYLQNNNNNKRVTLKTINEIKCSRCYFI
jgi:hypothetical protein